MDVVLSDRDVTRGRHHPRRTESANVETYDDDVTRL